ncbi:MAG: hypothetical protein ABL984_03855 [Pyrinomonadaceae bacterium]
MQWTNFDPSMLPPDAREIHVTLSPRGQFYLNQGAMMKLGEPVAVRLMFNKEERLIGIAAAPLKAKASFELGSKYGEEAPGRVFRSRPSATILVSCPKRPSYSAIQRSKTASSSSTSRQRSTPHDVRPRKTLEPSWRTKGVS